MSLSHHLFHSIKHQSTPPAFRYSLALGPSLPSHLRPNGMHVPAYLSTTALHEATLGYPAALTPGKETYYWIPSCNLEKNKIKHQIWLEGLLLHSSSLMVGRRNKNVAVATIMVDSSNSGSSVLVSSVYSLVHSFLRWLSNHLFRVCCVASNVSVA